jgi:hypothetical protein
VLGISLVLKAGSTGLALYQLRRELRSRESN